MFGCVFTPEKGLELSWRKLLSLRTPPLTGHIPHSVHGVGGVVGTLLLAPLGAPSLGGALPAASSFFPQLGLQALGVAAVAAYTLAVSAALLAATAALTGGLRVDAATEKAGLDASEFGEVGYLVAA